MHTSKRGAIIIGICCAIIIGSYIYYKRQHQKAPEVSSYTFKSIPPKELEISTTTFMVGETKQILGVGITLKSIDQDNRCPTDVQCIQAGNVVAHITVTSTNETKEFYPSTTGVLGDGHYTFSISDIIPAKHSDQQIKQSDYKITLQVSR